MIMTPHFKRIQGRRRLAIMCLAAVTALGVSIRVQGPTLLLWNASASVPEGLYVVQPNAPLHVGNLAVSLLPAGAQRLAADRSYLPSDVPLIKPVAAVQGSRVCRDGTALFVDGFHVADALLYDHRHRPMPAWQGCRVVTSSEVFLMNPAVPDSFDGRYFGPTALSLAKGRAVPLLTFPRRPRS